MRNPKHYQVALKNGFKIMNVRMPFEMTDRLDVLSKQQKMPRTKLINKATREFLERQQA